jgi:hypothetical protein
MRRRYLKGEEMGKPLLLRFTKMERTVLEGLAGQSGKNLSQYIRDKVLPRGGYDLHAALHPLSVGSK